MLLLFTRGWLVVPVRAEDPWQERKAKKAKTMPEKYQDYVLVTVNREAEYTPRLVRTLEDSSNI